MDWATLIAGIVSVFGNLFGGAWSNGRNVDMQRETNSLMQQLAGQANQWSIDQWYRENAYNTATAQRARLENANLNPALMMSQGGIMNEAAQSPSVQMPSGLSAPRVNNPINLDPLSFAQLKNVEAQTESIKHQTKREDEKQPLTLESLSTDIQSVKTNMEQVKELIEGIKKDNDRKDIENNILRETQDFAIQQFKDNAFITSENAKYVTLGILADIGLKEAQEEYNRGLANKTDEEVKQIKQLVRLNDLYYNMDKEEFEWMKENWNAKRPYLAQNAQNEAALMFRNAEGRRLMNELIARYGDWQSVVGLIKDFSGVISDVASAYRDIKVGGARRAQKFVPTSRMYR